MLTGKSIRQMRQMVGMKQIELAKKAGVERSKLSTAENGHRQLRKDELDTIRKVILSEARRRVRSFGKLNSK